MFVINGRAYCVHAKWKSDLVVMSQVYFDRQQAMLELYRKLDESEADFHKNPKVFCKKVMKELQKKFPQVTHFTP